MKKGIFCLFVLVSLSCKRDEIPEPVALSGSFDRAAMLSNIGNNIILPNYATLSETCTALKTSAENFASSPDSAGLVSLRNNYTAAYTAWQKCSVFEFGPAAENVLRSNLNTFPCDTNDIKNYISTGSYDLQTAAASDAKGFPALDYLLYGNGSNFSAILNNLSTTNGKKYLNDVCSEIQSLTAKVHNAWKVDGNNYIATFTVNTGTEAGSPTSDLVNQLNYDFEIIKTNKLAIPMGKKSLGTLLPYKVEAYYSGMSAALLNEQLAAIENVYEGANGLGLDDYLDYLKAQHTDGSLNNAILNQLTVAKEKCKALPDPLSVTISSNATLTEAAYTEIQKTIILLKTDMPSALGILITYQDNDGD